MLASVVKRADVAVYDTLKRLVGDGFPGGRNIEFGLKEGGVELALLARASSRLTLRHKTGRPPSGCERASLSVFWVAIVRCASPAS